MATAMQRQGQQVTCEQTSRARRNRAGHDERHATRAATPVKNFQPINRAHGAHGAHGDAPLGTIIQGYDPGDKRLFRVVRPASRTAWQDASEPTARIGDFRAWLRSLEVGAVVGVATSPERDPIATWLRETCGYGHVRVRAGQAGFAGEGTARAAHYLAYDRRGYPVGMGYLDTGLTLALDWLDGAGLSPDGAPRLLLAGEVLAMLIVMSAHWPSPERQAQMAADQAAAQAALDHRQPREPRVLRRVGIAGGR